MTAPRPWWEFPDEADEDASEAPDAPVAEEAKAGEGSRCKSTWGRCKLPSRLLRRAAVLRKALKRA